MDFHRLPRLLQLAIEFFVSRFNPVIGAVGAVRVTVTAFAVSQLGKYRFQNSR